MPTTGDQAAKVMLLGALLIGVKPLRVPLRSEVDYGFFGDASRAQRDLLAFVEFCKLHGWTNGRMEEGEKERKKDGENKLTLSMSPNAVALHA